MGYIGVRRRVLPEIIKKYAEAAWYLENETSGDIEQSALDLWNEIDEYWSDCELYDQEDYPNLKFEDLLPERVVQIHLEWSNNL